MAIELLSPAGNYEKLVTAFSYGADAAYMGLTSMRDEIATWPFDAFIVSDIGTVQFFRKNFPDKELHLSTQASCINSETAKMYRDMGFSRIILGREASLDDIKRIKDKVPELELEAFVHGAMCMAYSGRCLLSAHLAGRSGNQGDCAHTCRWKYRLALEEEERPGVYYPIDEEDDYTTILSSKDLCMIDHVKELEDAGLSSLKIEGRMKSVYYVAVVTRAYRKALDNDPELDRYKRDIFDVSHREFTTGFFFSSGPIEGEDVSRPTSYGYERNYMFLGTVRKDMGNGIFELDVRNQIRQSSPLEFIGPDVPLLKEEGFMLLDAEGNAADKLDHGKQGFIKTGLPLKPGYIMRCLSESEEKYIR